MSNIIDSIQLSGTTYQIQGSGGGVPENVFTAYTASTDSRIGEDEEVTAAALNALDEKIDSISGGGSPTVEVTQAEYDAMVSAGTVSADTYYIITDAQAGDLTQYWTSAQTQSAITQAVSGKQDTLVSGTNIKTINNESLLGSGNIDIQGGGKAVAAGTNISITTGETADTINCTLPIYVNPSTPSGDITFGKEIENSESNYYKLVIGQKIVTIGNSNGSGSIGIGVATNSSSDKNLLYGNNSIGIGRKFTIGRGTSSGQFAGSAIAIGYKTNALYTRSIAIGASATTNANDSVAIGANSVANAEYSFNCGKYNASNTGSTDADNTLFSVGNGTADNARHNAFEIRQNGDIYLTKDGQDVKLQDQLGGGGSITVDTALDSGSTNPVENRVIYNKIDEVEQVTAAALNNINDRLSEDEEVTAAGLNAVNDKFDGLKLKKLTQAEYNSLATKDASTLYIIVN